MIMTAIEYSFWPTPEEPEYGFLHCEDDDGNRWTLRGDVSLVQMIRDAPSHVLADLDIGGVWEACPGWPDEWLEVPA